VTLITILFQDLLVRNPAYVPNPLIDGLRNAAAEFLDTFGDAAWLDWARRHDLMPETAAEHDREVEKRRKMAQRQKEARAKKEAQAKKDAQAKEAQAKAQAEKRRQAETSQAETSQAGTSQAGKVTRSGRAVSTRVVPATTTEDDDVEMRSEVGSSVAKGKGKGRRKETEEEKGPFPPPGAIKVRRFFVAICRG
jgi:DNA segregation ATPase FtsK/SpoIIIE-like protein